jgi:hypothetical protein
MTLDTPDIPEVNSGRVNAIRDRLDEDRYTVNIQQLTKKLIDLEIALTGTEKTLLA